MMNRYNIEVIKRRLTCGLNVTVLKMPGYHTYSAFMVAPMGSTITPCKIDDVEIPYGIAHFLEHRLFDTQKGDAFARLSALGCDSNAFTSFDLTCYFFSCTSNLIEGVQVLFDMTTNLTFKEGAVTREKKIIIQEMKMTHDRPSDRLNEGMNKNLFVYNPVRMPIVGTEESINNTNLEKLKLTFETFYNVNSLGLYVIGDLDDSIFDELEKLTINKTVIKHHYKSLTPVEPLSIANDYRHTNLDIPTPLIEVAVKLPNDLIETLNVSKAQLLSLYSIAENMLFSDAGVFITNLRKKGLISSSVNGGISYTKDAATLQIITASSKVEDIEREFKEFIKNIDHYANLEEFERSKRFTLGQEITSLDSPENLIIEYINSCILNVDMFEQFSFYEKANYEDLLKMLETIKTLTPSVHVISKRGV